MAEPTTTAPETVLAGAQPAAGTVLAGATPPAGSPAAGEATDPKAKDGKTDEAKAGAPEKYENFKLPEGLEVDEKVMGEFQPLAKSLNLSQEQAQVLVDFQSKLMQASSDATNTAWTETLEAWATEARNDAEIGGLKFEETKQMAGRAMAAFGSPALKLAMDATGVGNHPEFIRVFAKIGKAIAEDKMHVGRAQETSILDLPTLLYPTMQQKQ